MISLTVALPMSVALFQQTGTIPREKIDPELREVKDEKTGDPV